MQGSAVTMTQQGTFTWAAMLSDGSYALTNEVDPSSTNPGVGTSTTTFWQFGPTPTAATLTGLPAGLAAGYPSFSPDDKFVSYIDVTSSTTNVDGPLNVAAYNAMNQTFSGVTTLASPASGQRIGYPGVPARRQRPAVRDRDAQQRQRQRHGHAQRRAQRAVVGQLHRHAEAHGAGEPQRQGLPAARPQRPRGQHRQRSAGLVQRVGPRRHDAQLRADGPARRRRRLRLGRLHQPPHVRQRAAVDALAQLAAATTTRTTSRRRRSRSSGSRRSI